MVSLSIEEEANCCLIVNDDEVDAGEGDRRVEEWLVRERRRVVVQESDDALATDLPETEASDKDKQDEYDNEPGCWGSSVCRPDSFTHQMIALAFMSFLCFGSFYCMDNPGALQNEIIEVMKVNTFEFANLYSWYSLPNLVLPVLGGYLIDGPMGLRKATIGFTVLICAGQLLFAVGAFVDSFLVMEAGRFVFGLGGESLVVAQNTYTVAWFKEKATGTAFGVQLSVSRAGSSINFLASGALFLKMQEMLGVDTTALGMTLLISGSFCVLSFLCAIALGWMDKRKERLSRSKQPEKVDSPNLLVIRHFPVSFWLLTAVCLIYYSVTYIFVSLGQVFVIRKYDMSVSTADAVISCVYLSSVPLAPALGYAIDRFGKNVSVLLFSVVLALLSHALLATSSITPWVPVFLLGLGYSVLASSLWTIVPFIVPGENLGVAFGLMQALQNGGTALETLLSGKIVDGYGYMWLETFFLANVAVALVCTVFIWIIDSSRDGYLNMTTKQRDDRRKAEEAAGQAGDEEGGRA